jgi:hypothetical protein
MADTAYIKLNSFSNSAKIVRNKKENIDPEDKNGISLKPSSTSIR